MALANIVIADAQATPVNHTFIPVGADADGVLWWEDQSAASPIGNWRIAIDVKRPKVPTAGDVSSASQRVIRPQISFSMPILETVSNSTVSGIAPAPTVAYVLRVTNGQFIIPERATSQNRKDLRKMFALLLADSQVVSLLENLVKPY